MKKKESYLTAEFSFEKIQLLQIIKGTIIGLLTGLLISLFRLAIEGLLKQQKNLYHLAHVQPSYLLLILAEAILAVLFIGWCLKKEPMIKGSGIPQVEGQLLGALSISWWPVLWRKTLAGILAIGSGLFLGREGPSIQLGATVGQGVNQLFKGKKINEKICITSGAGAGLAAAFNAPFAGLLFALEELQHNFSPVILVSTLSATITANFISLNFFGLKPVLNFGKITTLPLRYYPLLAGLGILLGIMAWVYSKVILNMNHFYQLFHRIPNYYLGIIPFILVIPIGFYAPDLLGGGSDIIISLIDNMQSIEFLLIIFLLRFIFSMISYSSGLPGGIFLPILCLGGLLGALFASFFLPLIDLDQIFIKNFIVVAMAGYLTAIVRSPLTSCILITEMVGNFDHLLAIAFVSLIAYIISGMLKVKPIYEEMLTNFVDEPHETITETKEILRIPIHTGSELDGRQIQDITWPDTCLIASITRGSNEILPNGQTTIFAGDILNILTDSGAIHVIHQWISPKSD